MSQDKKFKKQNSAVGAPQQPPIENGHNENNHNMIHLNNQASASGQESSSGGAVQLLQHSTSKLVGQASKESNEISATKIHLNVASADQLDRFPGSGPQQSSENPHQVQRKNLKRRKSGISADSNGDFGASNRSKGAPARASTFTQAFVNYSNVQSIHLGSAQQPFTQVQVGKTLKRKLVKFSKSKLQ